MPILTSLSWNGNIVEFRLPFLNLSYLFFLLWKSLLALSFLS
nr:MAG TPA: hypothetical protein [Caudoviricetes sp.]